MEALASEGNVAEALRVFDRLRTLLRDELGTSPSPGTIETYERLLHPAGRRREMAAEAEPDTGAVEGARVPCRLSSRRAAVGPWSVASPSSRSCRSCGWGPGRAAAGGSCS